MYVSSKILAFGTNSTYGDYVIIKGEDYPNDSEMRRTTYCPSVEWAKQQAEKSEFTCTGSPPSSSYIGVEVNYFKKFHPYDCITKAQVLAQYTAKQRDDAEGRVNFAVLVSEMGVDIFKDPKLKELASKLWSAAVSSQSEIVV